MGRRLYVGGLSFDTTEERLRKEFAKFGVVKSANVMRHRYSSRSRGFGFVEMGNAVEAEEALRIMNGTALDGRRIIVDHARQDPGSRWCY